MIEKTVEIGLKDGLKARPATLFVQEANRFKADIFVEAGDRQVNAKSIMSLMSLAIRSGTAVTIKADGDDAFEAIKALTEFVRTPDVLKMMNS
ncbi:HPr family phosphocarrier protein [Salisediminibacterium halotolerans]|uniref:Catabolite repression HPr-like protein n=1 Tax=Salisediminibacterium halotolerans TaxID=517425 RepID=A0A1H9TAD2_9BACI|nr:HPr family phosphocarrier protein [Salisediminibacterium haloalkalitolerans]SER94088.1 catabolite repression HPr-like protein [Salisediminibacterium haloalkalitolerans]